MLNEEIGTSCDRSDCTDGSFLKLGLCTQSFSPKPYILSLNPQTPVPLSRSLVTTEAPRAHIGKIT
jgi:hypothetical protein